jgi:hypothetical protein
VYQDKLHIVIKIKADLHSALYQKPNNELNQMDVCIVQFVHRHGDIGTCIHFCRGVQFDSRDIYHCCISCSCRGLCIQEFVSGLSLATKVHPLS